MSIFVFMHARMKMYAMKPAYEIQGKISTKRLKCYSVQVQAIMNH